MAGLWISRIARQLTQPDTFDRLVSPAIADLQLESEQTRLARWRHYPALVAVLLWALLRDVSRELGHLFDAEAWRTVWTRTAVWALIAATVSWALQYWLVVKVLHQWHTPDATRQTILNGIVFRSAGPALTVAMIVAAYNFKRRDATRTISIVTATLVIAVTTIGATYLSTMLQAPSTQALAEAGRTFYGSVIAVRRPPLPWQLLLNAIMMIPFAWLGVVLARRRGWSLALIATGILGSYVWLNTSATPLYFRVARSIPGLETLLFGTYGIPTNLMTLVGLIALWRLIERVFVRAHVAIAR